MNSEQAPLKIQLFRIDDRLIHGQVVIGWASALNSKKIILCDDSVAENDWEKELYLSVVPETLEAEVFSIEALAAYLNNNPQDLDKTIIVVNSPQVIEDLMQAGILPGPVNVGGIHFREGRHKFLSYLYLTEEEVETFRRCIGQGIQFYCQDVPNSKAVSLEKVIS